MHDADEQPAGRPEICDGSVGFVAELEASLFGTVVGPGEAPGGCGASFSVLLQLNCIVTTISTIALNGFSIRQSSFLAVRQNNDVSYPLCTECAQMTNLDQIFFGPFNELILK